MEDWNKSTVNQLKAECIKRSLDTTGKKADLVARLEEYSAQEEEYEDAEQMEEGEGAGYEEGDEYYEEGEGEGEEYAGDDVVVEGEEEYEHDEGEHGEEAGEEHAQDEAAEQGEEQAEQGGDQQEGEGSEAVESAMEDGEKKEEKEKPVVKANLKKAITTPKIPIKKVVRTEYQAELRVRRVVLGPLSIEDMENAEFVDTINRAETSFVRFGKDLVGHAQLRMKTYDDAKSLVDSMTEKPFKEGLIIKQLGPEDGQNVDVILKGESEKVQEKFDVRMLYVHNVPESATEGALKMLLPKAVSACIPKDEKRSPKGYALVEFEDSETMEATLKSVKTLTLHDNLMTVHRIPANVYEQQSYVEKQQRQQQQQLQKFSPGRPTMNRPTNFNNRGGRRMEQRGNFQQRGGRPFQTRGGRPGFQNGGRNPNWGGNRRPLFDEPPSNWGNPGNQGGSRTADAVNLIVGLSQMLSNRQQDGPDNENFGGGNYGMGNQGYRQGNFGGQEESQDQWNRKRRANEGNFNYGKMQRQDNYGGGFSRGGHRGGRRY